MHCRLRGSLALAVLLAGACSSPATSGSSTATASSAAATSGSSSGPTSASSNGAASTSGGASSGGTSSGGTSSGAATSGGAGTTGGNCSAAGLPPLNACASDADCQCPASCVLDFALSPFLLHPNIKECELPCTTSADCAASTQHCQNGSCSPNLCNEMLIDGGIVGPAA